MKQLVGAAVLAVILGNLSLSLPRSVKPMSAIDPVVRANNFIVRKLFEHPFESAGLKNHWAIFVHSDPSDNHHAWRNSVLEVDVSSNEGRTAHYSMPEATEGSDGFDRRITRHRLLKLRDGLWRYRSTHGAAFARHFAYRAVRYDDLQPPVHVTLRYRSTPITPPGIQEVASPTAPATFTEVGRYLFKRTDLPL